MFHLLVDFQREIYSQLSELIRQFADGSGWVALLAMLPMGVVFGAAHALTPGHSKAVLATYIAGSPIGTMRALATSLALSFTHVTMAVLIAVFSLPLVSIALGRVGRAPALETISRGMLGVIGLWMLSRAFRKSNHHAHEGEAFGFVAGLVPCPLTLFVMTFAISRGVPEAGFAFAVAMMGGVAIVLSGVALFTSFARNHITQLLERRPGLVGGVSRVFEGVAGAILLALAIYELGS